MKILTLACGVTAALAMLAGCENQAPPKDMEAKYHALAADTHHDKEMLDRKKVSAPTTTTDLTGGVLNFSTTGGVTITGKFASGTLTVPAPVVVVPPTPPVTPAGIPAGAVSSGILDSNAVVNGSKDWPWKFNHDAGTPGSTTAAVMTYPFAGVGSSTTAFHAQATQTGLAGEIWHLSFASNDFASTHFVYDAYVSITDPTQVANVEMDMNQVLANGLTVILATQCSHYSGTWEWTTTTGGTHWNKGNIPCDPTKWTPNQFHHIQIATERDATGVVTYDWVNFDGVLSNFVNAKGLSAEQLNWAKVELLNFQLDGTQKAGGTMSAVVDQLQIWKW